MDGTAAFKFAGGALIAGLCAGAGVIAALIAVTAAEAGGWASVHRYVKPSGKCFGQEVLASYYSYGKRTASGEVFDVDGNTAAARTWPLGSVLTLTNPHNGRSLSVRINDRGPWGVAFAQGARLDLARGAARRLGMSGSQYLCVTEGVAETVGAAGAGDGLVRDFGARQD